MGFDGGRPVPRTLKVGVEVEIEADTSAYPDCRPNLPSDRNLLPTVILARWLVADPLIGASQPSQCTHKHVSDQPCGFLEHKTVSAPSRGAGVLHQL